MTLPPVVSDPERCPARSGYGVSGALQGGYPHAWDGVIHRMIGGPDDGAEYRVCRYCGGRRPEDVDDWPPRDSND